MQLLELERLAAAKVRGRRVVVGLSGGMDSVALITALVRAGADVRAAHVDHGLRADSSRDASFCRDIAANLGIPYASSRIQVSRGNSTQGRARTQRYAALIRIAAELGADTLAVAHHADDAWESSVLQAQRGAGAIGIAGPREESEWWGFPLVRPFLSVPRSAIADYTEARSLRWLDDPSNDDPHYARVRIRQSESPVWSAIEANRTNADALEQRCVPIADRAQRLPQQVTFARTSLGSDPEVIARVLLDTARSLHGELPRSLVHDIIAAVSVGTDTTRHFCGRRVIVEVSGSEVVLLASRGQGTRLLAARRTPDVPMVAGLEFPWFGHQIRTSASRIADSDDEVGEGTVLRGPLPGDRISTDDGVRKVADVLSALRVSARKRWSWPCLFVGDRCVAIAEGPVCLPPANKGGIFVHWERFVP